MIRSQKSVTSPYGQTLLSRQLARFEKASSRAGRATEPETEGALQPTASELPRAVVPQPQGNGTLLMTV